AQASAAEPKRPEFAWLYLAQCINIANCNPQPIEAKLHELDPDNGAAALGSLSRAARAKDARAVQARMREIGKSQRFDIYWNPNIVHVANVLSRSPTANRPEAVIQAIGAVNATIPAFQEIANACRGDALQSAEVVTTCRNVSTALRHGDTYIAEMVGLSIAKRVWPENSAEYRAVLEQGRVSRYRRDLSGMFSTPEDLERYLQLLETHRSEQDVVVAQIVDAGLSPNPPGDWAGSRQFM